ncbi:MAG: amino acid adenylation domain-containing protein, partial [bacterium]|nr:amino acid adenylation domain-containing protein [bacterium]
MARWLAGGSIEFLGRMDQQVKVRGFRVELGEIENRLLEHASVKEVVVLALSDGDGNKYLCSYVVPGGAAAQMSLPLDPVQLKDYLSRSLPDYMIPSHYVPMERIPLTSNGKVDRKSLPGPQVSGNGSGYVAPRDEVEEKLAGLWENILMLGGAASAAPGNGGIGIDDNFFHLGGHSLKAMHLVALIHKTFHVRIPFPEIFETPVIRDLARRVKELRRDEGQAVEVVEEKEYYPLSSAQQRIFLLYRMNPLSINYNMPLLFTVAGDTRRDTLETALLALIERHESLRTSFRMLNEEPVQEIHFPVGFQTEDIGAGIDGSGDRGSKEFIKRFVRPFDLSVPPVLRVGLGTASNGGDCFLAIDMHHVMSDGISLQVFLKELIALYNNETLAPLRFRYRDYTRWQQGWKEGEGFKKSEAYWLGEFMGEVPVLNLPLDHSRPLVRDDAGSFINFQLDPEKSAALKGLSDSAEVTLYVLLLSAYTVLLSRLSGQEDIVVGSPIAGREDENFSGIMGMFVNTLAMRSSPGGHKRFQHFLMEVKDRALNAFENQGYPLEELVKKVMVNRDGDRNALFDTMFSMQNIEPTPLSSPALTLKPFSCSLNTAKFDLALQAEEVGENIDFSFEYSTVLFNEETVQRFPRYFKKIIAEVIDSPLKTLGKIDCIPEEEKHQLLVEFNDTRVEYPEPEPVHLLFEKQAEKTPDRIAITGDGETVTYAELNIKSNQLARVLIEKGVRQDTITIVAIMMERSIEMVTGIFAILKAGAAYLPIDPGYPGERVNYMLKDSAAKVIVTDGLMVKKLVGSGQPTNKPINRQTNKRANLAYIIYTSGSTGKPKGTMVEHHSLNNIIFALNEQYPFGADDTYLLKTSYVFDVSLTELFGWFWNGGRLSLLEPGEEKDPVKILESIESTGVTHINFVPSMFSVFVAMLNSDNILKLSRLKYLFLAGEQLPGNVMNRFNAFDIPVKVENLYGPTETTVYTTVYPLSQWDGDQHIPIGKAFPNVQRYIRSKDGYLQPIGVPGELYIGGVGVARGYLNQPELTNEKFDPNSSLYRTGDLAKWLPDGNVLFLGRMDDQVKIRGFRIELGEIENRLLRHAEVKEAVVIAKEEEAGDLYLIAYYIPVQGDVVPLWDREIPGPELRDYLSSYLPDYMIPGYFVHLDRIPLTVSGKVNRRLLPEPHPQTNPEYTAPRNRVETKLVELWSDVLGIETHLIGIDNNFFQLGGHSLKGAVLTARIQKELDVDVPLAQLFKTSHIRGLAEYITGLPEYGYQEIEPVEKREYYDLSSAQKRLYILWQMEPDGLVYNMPQFIVLEGGRESEPDTGKLEESFKQLIQRHESLRTSFHMIDDQPVQIIQDHVEFRVCRGVPPWSPLHG